MHVMNASRWGIGVGGVLSALSLALALAIPSFGAADAKLPKRRGNQQIVMLTGFGAGGNQAADPRRAALLSKSGLGDDFGSGTFRFTPSANASRRAVTVAVRARATTRTDAVKMATATANQAPDAYNLGVAVNWKRFALSGDIARVEGSLLPDNREAAEIGVSYTGNRWNTRLEASADRPIGARPRLMGLDESYSLGLGGAYALSRNLAVTGGVRYRMQLDRTPLSDDQRRDSQSVYIGTAFRF